MLVVEVERASACADCGLCAAPERCAYLLEVDGRGLSVAVGDVVLLSMPAVDLVKASTLAYLVPLLLFGVGLAMMHVAGGGHPGWTALGGAAGLVAGFRGAQLLERRLCRKGHFKIKAVSQCSA